MAEPDVVRLVVLNYNGGAELCRCFEHLTALDWPADQIELVLVDNASHDGSADLVEATFPHVQVIRRARNDGFPANNDAMRDLRSVRYLGLVNNDAFMEPDALAPLVQALDDDPQLGAASPLMVFDQRFVDVEVVAPAARPGRGDPRQLGVMITGLRVDGRDVWSRARFRQGGHGREVGPSGMYEWTSHHAVLAVPVPRAQDHPRVVEVAVRALEPKTVTFRSGDRQTQISVGRGSSWITVGVDGPSYEVVNNAGSVVFDDGYGADRGFGQPLSELGPIEPDEFAWCGGAVLLRPSYLVDVGLFDERFFLYYEDTDLSWRGLSRGWRYRFVPSARVRHQHATSTGEGSARFAYFTERNRLVMVIKNGSPTLVRRAVGGYLGQTYDAARRDIAGALVQGRRPNVTPLLRRLRALAGLVWKLPAVLVQRRRIRARATVPAAVVEERLVRR